MDSSSDVYGDQASLPMGEAAVYAALSRVAVGDRPLEERLHEVAVLAGRALPEAPEASVTLVRSGLAHTAAFTGDVARTLDERQYGDGHGPCLDAAHSRATICVAMDDAGSPYPDFRRLAMREGISHSLSVSIPASGRVTAALNLYSSTGPFSADSARVAGTFAGLAGLALAALNSDDAAATAVAGRLHQALASRRVISQAQGVLMAQRKYSREEAFTTLMGFAEQEGVSLYQAAQAVVEKAAGPSGGG